MARALSTAPPTWTQTGWAVVKISREGTLLGWMRGTVGAQLPQSAGAAETVAVLAGAIEAAHAVQLHTDYQNLDGLERAPHDVVSHRKAIYAGPRIQARARAPEGSKVQKVRGHANLEDCHTEQERFEAMCNAHADAVARGAAATTGSPTERAIQDWQYQVAFLHRFLRYVPRALALWPQTGPTDGRTTLPKRPGASKRAGRASFVFDVLGVLGVSPTEIPSTTGGSSRESHPAQESATPSAGSAGPPEAPAPQAGSHEDAAEPRKHEWRWKEGR